MPIHDLARDVAKQIRKRQQSNPETTGAYHIQLLSEIDGRYHWMCLTEYDLDGLTRDQDLEAVVQAMLINHRIIEAPSYA